MNGFLNVLKSSGVRSAAVIRNLKRSFPHQKIGYVGTLDEFASGVLPVALGQATRLSDILHTRPKTYQAEIKFGIETDTHDCTGNVVTEIQSAVDEAALEKILNNYTGSFEQMPPRYSSKKINGRRASDLARAGKDVELKPKKVEIYSIDIIKPALPDAVVINISCSSGTYIRSLARDIGRDLGCGAHLTALHRISVGPFQDTKAKPVSRLSEKDIIPMQDVLGFLPALTVNNSNAQKVMHGQTFNPEWAESGLAATEGLYTILNGQRMIGLISLDNGRWRYRMVFQQK